MGVDTKAIVAFGTQEDVTDKLPKEYTAITDKDQLKYYTCKDYRIEDQSDLSDKEKEIVCEFMDFNMWHDEWSDSFEGFGVDGLPGEVDEDRVREIFKKYDLGEPKWIKFVHYY